MSSPLLPNVVVVLFLAALVVKTPANSLGRAVNANLPTVPLLHPILSIIWPDIIRPMLLIPPTLPTVRLGTRLVEVEDMVKLVPSLALISEPIEVPVDAVIMFR